MQIELKIENKEVEIFLKNDDIVLDKAIMRNEYRLSEELLLEIENLLVKNELTIADIKKANLISDMNDNFTTQRIALTTIKAINWGVSISK